MQVWKNDVMVWTSSIMLPADRAWWETTASNRSAGLYSCPKISLYELFFRSLRDISLLSDMKLTPVDRFNASEHIIKHRAGVEKLFGSPTTFGVLYSLVHQLVDDSRGHRKDGWGWGWGQREANLILAAVIWNCLSNEDRARVPTYSSEVATRRSLLTLLTGHLHQKKRGLPPELWEQVIGPMLFSQKFDRRG